MAYGENLPWEDFEHAEYLYRIEDLLGEYFRASPDSRNARDEVAGRLEETALEFVAYRSRLRMGFVATEGLWAGPTGALVEDLERQGVRLRVEHGRLQATPPEALTPGVMGMLRARREEIIALLSGHGGGVRA